jgi:amidohydrolase
MLYHWFIAISIVMNLIEIRHNLHKNAELSGKEILTSQIISNLLLKLNPEKLIRNLGGNGVMAIFDSGKEGPSVLFRADIDAVPVQEINVLPYKSIDQQVSHKCGHDGHSAILLGVAEYVSNNRPLKGRIALLFQPAEEVGSGAFDVINDDKFKEVAPDYVFAMHNLPGYNSGALVVREGTIAAASKGIKIELKGISSHASEPEKGISPIPALADLMHEITLFVNDNQDSEEYALITIVHVNSGNAAFGSSPGNAVLMLTLRAWTDRVLEEIFIKIIKLTNDITANYKLQSYISTHDVFPAVVNEPSCVQIIRQAARCLSIELVEATYPFRWSEDFAHFTGLSKGALFGIGAGRDHAPLHNKDYDFPDEIMSSAVSVWAEIYKSLLMQG